MLANLTRGGRDGEKIVDKWARLYPSARWALIFHENGFGAKLVFPPEFIGEKNRQS